MLNLASNLEYNAIQNPTKTAIIFDKQRFSFAQLDNLANKVANALKNVGINKGDRVSARP
ncbi:MAG: AMP-binding protein [Desulfobacterales bacterium]|nr:AMP-binding protein [Desulfobacterales bacterium]